MYFFFIFGIDFFGKSSYNRHIAYRLNVGAVRAFAFPGERERKAGGTRASFFDMALPGGAALYAAAIGAK